MLEWLKTHVPGYDSTVGAIIGAATGIGLYLTGRWALHRDKMSAAEAKRWDALRATIDAIQSQQQQHEIRIGQTMTRAEITELVRSGNVDLLAQITGRMDRTDRIRERAHDELSAKLDLLIGNSIRRLEDYEAHRMHLVDPKTGRE